MPLSSPAPMTTSETEQAETLNRLCNEIKLFDLCELERCSFKSGTFCTKSDLLVRFEKIAEVDERLAEGVDCNDCDDEENISGDDFEDEEFGDGFGEFEQD